MHTMQNTKKGFTLIELLIVITIIGILAAALLPQVLGAPARARDAARVADMNQIVTALETYATDNGSYPASTAGCIPAALDTYFQGGATPSDAQGLGTGDCAASYYYCTANSPNNYILAAVLENTGGQSANALETELPDCSGGGPVAAPGSFTEDATSDIHVVVK